VLKRQRSAIAIQIELVQSRTEGHGRALQIDYRGAGPQSCVIQGDGEIRQLDPGADDCDRSNGCRRRANPRC
jgi:hypothetical protein